MADEAESTRGTSAPVRDDTLPTADDDDLVDSSERPARYRLGIELGRGGMGRVVEAFDTQLGRTVALKEVLPRGGAGIQRRFLREVQITARLEHASIVPLYDSGTTRDGRPYYVMRRVSGRPLDDMFSRMRTLAERLTLLPAMLSAIDAIAHAHARGIIHRDLKPANILVGVLGETVVIDWGLAKVIGEEDGDFEPVAADSLQTQAGSVFGTPGFMAPEQARGEQLGAHGDVYALGATLYQLLAGKPPHAGNSASEVLDRTVNNDPVPPLAEVSPGAPPELVAIVDKALSFDPAMRYPNAAALGEDVRRFHNGQIVAAHRYTSRQRISRFAKRHRAPLVVGALAMVTLAVAAWIGVHKIIHERDAADGARQLAVADKRVAEDARDRLIKQADTLIVTEAAALVARNPTEAVAVLKGLSPHSRKQDDARGIGEEASVRGVAWAMQTADATPIQVELSPDATRVFEVTLDDTMLRVFDLDGHRLMIARPVSRTTRAVWVDNGKHLLVTHSTAPPELLDPETGTVQTIPLPPITSAIATSKGDRVIYIDGHDHAGIMDIATRTAKLVGPDHADRVDIALDGSWYMVGDSKLAVAYNNDGAELVRYTGAVSVTALSRFQQMAVMDGRKVFVASVASPHPVWSEVPLEIPSAHRPIAFAFRGRELEILSTNATMTGWENGHLVERLHMDNFTFRGVEAGSELMLVAVNEGRLAYFDGMSTGQILLPAAAPHIRIAAHPGGSRVVVAGNSVLFIYDLAAIVPRIIKSGGNPQAAFVDDHTMLFFPLTDWYWYDTTTGIRTPFESGTHGLSLVLQIDADGRVLVKDLFDSHDGHDVARLIELRRGSTKPRVIATGSDLFATFLEGDAIVMSAGDNRVLGAVGDEVPREIVRLDGSVEALAAAGHHQFVALSATGDLVRGSLDSADVERAKTSVGRGAVLGGSNGFVVIGSGNRLLRWDTTVHELARFDKPIKKLEVVESGVIAVLVDNETLFVDSQAGATHRLFAAGRNPPVANVDGTTLVALGANDDVRIVEVPSIARFTLPRLFPAGQFLNVSPDGRHVAQQDGDWIALWTLPAQRDDLTIWLDELTNASEDAENMLVWPWQLKSQ